MKLPIHLRFTDSTGSVCDMNLRKERIGEAQVADALCAVPVAAAVTSMMIIAIKRRGKNNGDGSAGTERNSYCVPAGNYPASGHSTNAPRYKTSWAHYRV